MFLSDNQTFEKTAEKKNENILKDLTDEKTEG